MDLKTLLTNPEFLAAAIMLIYPQLFEALENFLTMRLGERWKTLISLPFRKRLLAWALAVPVAFAAYALALALFPGDEPFTFDAAYALAGAVVTVVLGQASFALHRAFGLLIMDRRL